MKIYNKITLDIDSWKVLEEDSFEYSGDLMLCDATSSSSTTLNFGENTSSTNTGVTQDTYLDDEFPTYNFGDSTTLEFQREMSPGLKTVLIRFNLQAIESIIISSNQILNATLYMKTTTSTQDEVIAAAYRVL